MLIDNAAGKAGVIVIEKIEIYRAVSAVAVALAVVNIAVALSETDAFKNSTIDSAGDFLVKQAAVMCKIHTIAPLNFPYSILKDVPCQSAYLKAAS